jgi:hypothetical protein
MEKLNDGGKDLYIIYGDKFPTGEYENWERCRSLFPHVRAAMSQRPGAREPLLSWATLLYRGAWYASETGNIAGKSAAALFGSL